MKWRVPTSLIISIGMHAGIVFLIIFTSRDAERIYKSNIPLSLVSRDRTVVTAAGSAGHTEETATTDAPAIKPVSPRRQSGNNPQKQEPSVQTPSQIPSPGSEADRTSNNKTDGTPLDLPVDRQTVGTTSMPPDSDKGSGDGMDIGENGTESDPICSESGNGGAGDINGKGSNNKGSVTGKTDGNAPGIAQTAVDTQIGDYALLVRRRLEQRGAYPKTARRLGLEGRVEMVLKINGTGTIADTRIHTSSGFRQLDEAALASAGSIGLLPPPPDSRSIEIVVPIRFSMRRM